MSVGRTNSRWIGRFHWRLPLLVAVMASPFVYFSYIAIDNPTGDLVSSVYTMDLERIEPIISN